MKQYLLLTSCILWHTTLSSWCNSLNQVLLPVSFGWSIPLFLEILVSFWASVCDNLAVVSRFTNRLCLVQKCLCRIAWGLGEDTSLVRELILFAGCCNWGEGSWTRILGRREVVWVVWVGIWVVITTLATLGAHKVSVGGDVLRQTRLATILFHWLRIGRFRACHSSWITIIKLKCILHIVAVFGRLRSYNAISLCNIDLLLCSKNVLTSLSTSRLSTLATFVLIACFLKFTNVRL